MVVGEIPSVRRHVKREKCMSRIWIVMGALMILAFSTTATLAEMPEELKGTWILDAQATEHYIMTSPKWKPETAKYLPTIMERMSYYVFEFDEGVIIASRRAKKETLPVALKENDKKKYVFKGEIRNQTITMTVTFVNDTTINIRSSATDDMDYYLWKRGRLDKNRISKDDRSQPIELMKKALNNSSIKSDEADNE